MENTIGMQKAYEKIEKEGLVYFQNGVVEAYEEYTKMNEKLCNDPLVSFETKQMAQEQITLLQKAQCFEIHPDLFKFALHSESTCDLDAPVSVECRPPADIMFIYCIGTLGWMTINYGDYYNIFFGVLASMLNKPLHEINETPLQRVATLKIGEPLLYLADTPYVSMSGQQRHLVYDFLLVLRAVNNPRLTIANNALTRQQRRNKNIGMGKAVDAWHKVTWNINEPVKAKIPYDEKFHKMPLHWNRGHWKRAQEHHPKSQQRPNALNINHRDLWWTWIDGYWAGHPAFGFKKQYHAPKI